MHLMHLIHTPIGAQSAWKQGTATGIRIKNLRPNPRPATVTTNARPSSITTATATEATPLPSSEYSTAVPRLTDAEQTNEIISSMAERSAMWYATDAAARVVLLQEVRTRVIKSVLKIGEASAQTQGYMAEDGTADGRMSSLFGLTFGTVAGRVTNALIELMQSLEASLPPLRPQQSRTASTGAAVFAVSPITKLQKNDIGAAKATELYVQAGKESTQAEALQAAYMEPKDGVCVVLAGGNQASLCFVDVLHKLFVENAVVVLKHHDALSIEAPVIEYCLEPLKEAGCYQGVHCDVPLTSVLLNSPHTSRAHMTGSVKTHDAIVWGPPGKQQARRYSNDPQLKCPMTSELGNVTPVVVTPALWSQADLDRSAGNIVGSLKLNSGCNCLSPKVVVIPAEWNQADAFEAALKAALTAGEPTTAWYPGTEEVHEAFCRSHTSIDKIMPTGETVWTAGKPVLPYAVASVTLSSPEEAANIAGIQSEFFAPVLIVARLSMAPHLASEDVATLSSMSSTPADAHDETSPTAAEKAATGALACAFLKQFPSFLNKYTWGNLIAAVHAHRDIEAEYGDQLTLAIDEMKYGSIVVNDFTYTGYTSAWGMWGGFQDSRTSMANPGSGVGHVMNAFQFDHPQKQVLWNDFDKMPPTLASTPPGWVSKGLVGLLNNGIRGVWQAANA